MLPTPWKYRKLTSQVLNPMQKKKKNAQCLDWNLRQSMILYSDDGKVPPLSLMQHEEYYSSNSDSEKDSVPDLASDNDSDDESYYI